MHNAIKMVQNYIKTYGFSAQKLQEYLERLFPGQNIDVNVSNLLLSTWSKAFFKAHIAVRSKTPNEGSQTANSDHYVVDLPQQLLPVSLT